MKNVRRSVTLVYALLVCLSGFAFADDHDHDRHSDSHNRFNMTAAEWRSDRNRLEVDGDGGSRVEVVVSNAGSGDTLGSVTSRRDSWHFRMSIEHDAQVPCEVSAVRTSDGRIDKRAVRHAPRNCDSGSGGDNNQPPVANANGPYAGIAGEVVNFSSAGSSDPEQGVLSYLWRFGDGNTSTEANPTHSYSTAGDYNVSLTVTDEGGVSTDNSTTALIQASGGPGDSDISNVSINSTSQNGMPGAPVPEQPFINDSGYKVFAVNDLGMHCGDFDTRVSSILPPFNVLHATVIQRGQEPNVLGPNDVSVYYSAASNPNDPVLTGINSAESGPVYSSMVNGVVFKTNFWNTARGAYNAFYPPGILPAFYPDIPVDGILDLGLPMPNVERLFLGDGVLTADQQAMPGRNGPYVENAVQQFTTYVNDQPFFIDMLDGINRGLQFGYVVEGVNWFEAPGVPVSTFDDYGRENPWPLYRIQAKIGNNTVASVDTVVPISGEANCGACHGSEFDGGNGLATADLSVITSSLDDPMHGLVPDEVSKEYAADLNLIRLHDQKHGTDLESRTPVVCQQCHYTPALDLAQLGPLGSGPGQDPYGNYANGREQAKVRSMSNVMHSHHGSLRNSNGDLVFPVMPEANKDEFGMVTNHAERRQVLQETCYQCHPGRRTDCLRGAMSNGGMLCQDCHGDMNQVGSDFTNRVSPVNPGDFILGGDFYTNADQPRVPWANEPGCGSCHTGDAVNNLAGMPGTVVNPADADGNPDNIRLFKAYVAGDAKATPIVPSNKRFAENVIEADNPAVSGANDPRIGNPMLYRVSIGHEGLFCETCHGSTHGIWPNKNDLANDNVAATQLQGHKGTVIECSTCHEGDLGNTLGGPHGMHPVGDTRFADGGHESLAERSSSECKTCHGSDGLGTVLSRVASDRVLQCDDRTSFCPDGNSTTFPKGHMVGCTECHGNKIN